MKLYIKSLISVLFSLYVSTAVYGGSMINVPLKLSQIKLVAKPVQKNTASDTWGTVVRIKNKSHIASRPDISGPLTLVVSLKKRNDIILSNATGRDENGNYYLTIPADEHSLVPGNIIKLPLYFKNPSNKPFKVSYKLLGYVYSSTAPATPNGCILMPYTDCSGMNLAGSDLSGKDLTGSKFVGTNFTGANLSRANLLNANLHSAILTNTKLDYVWWWNTTCPDNTVISGMECGKSIARSESGFSFIESISYSFMKPSGETLIKYETTPAQLWYTFHPSEEEATDPSQTPIFVMLNGGPGAATSANLFANNTAPYTLNLDVVGKHGIGYAVNEHRWTKLGHVLYIDPALTGFSYNIGPEIINDPEPLIAVPARAKEFFQHGNFNPFIDAAQVLRVVLRFLDSHDGERNLPNLIRNPVVFVGESYGGTRVSTMLNFLLFSTKYDDNGTSFYHDPGLVKEIKEHLLKAGQSIDAPSPELVVSQFGKQILIQPQLTSYQGEAQTEMFWQDNSILDTIAKKSGVSWPNWRKTCGLVDKKYLSACLIKAFYRIWDIDRYNWSQMYTWSDDLDDYSGEQLNQLGELNAILGGNLDTLPGLKPAYRAKPSSDRVAYKALGVVTLPQLTSYFGLAPNNLILGDIDTVKNIPDRYKGSLEDHFGRLGRWDNYFITMNWEVYAAYFIPGTFPSNITPEYNELPLSADYHSTYGDLFLENIRYLQTFLTDAYYDLVIYSDALPKALERHGSVERIDRRPGSLGGAGRLDINYKDKSVVKIYNPFYRNSGHAVSSSEPGLLYMDVENWLNCTKNNTCFID